MGANTLPSLPCTSIGLWRLIPPIVLPGAVQMAVDAWLLYQHQQGLSPPVLRFYTWQPAALSLGYHQGRWPADWATLQWQGRALELVRRPSGGRAVLHQGDLTYALITSGLPSKRQLAYQHACQFLIDGFAALDLPLVFGAAGRSYRQNPSCFGTATGADLILAADPRYKLIGSAQLWHNGALLQHGSIQLQPEPQLYCQVFGQLPLQSSAVAKLAAQTPQLIETLVAAAGHCFGAAFETVPLAAEEIAAATAAHRLAVEPVV